MNYEASISIFTAKRYGLDTWVGYIADTSFLRCRFKSIIMRAVSFIKISSSANALLNMDISRNT